MLNQKGFSAPIIIVSIFLILLGGLGGFYIGKYKFNDPVAKEAFREVPNLVRDEITNKTEEVKSLPTDINNLENTPPNLKNTEGVSEIAKVVIEDHYKNPNNQTPIQFSIASNDGQFARGGLNNPGYGGGWAWFAVKYNGKWEVAHKGHDIPECSKIAKYNIPKDVLGCVEGY